MCRRQCTGLSTSLISSKAVTAAHSGAVGMKSISGSCVQSVCSSSSDPPQGGLHTPDSPDLAPQTYSHGRPLLCPPDLLRTLTHVQTLLPARKTPPPRDGITSTPAGRTQTPPQSRTTSPTQAPRTGTDRTGATITTATTTMEAAAVAGISSSNSSSKARHLGTGMMRPLEPKTTWFGTTMLTRGTGQMRGSWIHQKMSAASATARPAGLDLGDEHFFCNTDTSRICML